MMNSIAIRPAGILETFMRQHRSQRATAEQMHMNMINFLTTVAVAVHDQTVSVFGHAFLFSNFRGYCQHTA